MKKYAYLMKIVICKSDSIINIVLWYLATDISIILIIFLMRNMQNRNYKKNLHSIRIINSNYMELRKSLIDKRMQIWYQVCVS